MGRIWPTVAFALIALMSSAELSTAIAANCTAARNASAASSAGEVAQLRRQLVAIQGIERQRSCSKRSAIGGFFNACGDLAQRRAAIQSQLGRVSAVRKARGDCDVTASRRDQRQKRNEVRAAGRDGLGGMRLGNTAMLYCVRLRDGYFFPAPNSQFAEKTDLGDTLDQCRFICDDPQVDLYTLDDISRETGEMMSVAGRVPYTTLPAAFKYREDASFKTCDLQRYYRRVNELRARTVTPRDMTNAIIPLPTAKPVEQPQAGVQVSEAAAPELGYAETAPKRDVRMVGPIFFPDQ